MAPLVQRDATVAVPHLHKAPAMSHLCLLGLQLVTLTSLWTASERAAPFVSHMLANVGFAVAASAVGKEENVHPEFPCSVGKSCV